MTRQHGLRAGDAKGAAQGHHSLANLDFAQTGIACALDDEFRSLQIAGEGTSQLAMEAGATILQLR